MTAAAPATTWRDLGRTRPPVVVAAAGRSPILTAAAAVLIGVVVPSALVARAAGPLVAMAVWSAAALLAVCSVPRRSWTGRLVVAAIAAAAVAPQEGPGVASVLFVSLLLAVWSTAGRAPLPVAGRPAPGAAAIAVAGATVAVVLRQGSAFRPLLAVGLATLVVAVSCGRTWAAGRAGAGIAARVELVITGVVAGVALVASGVVATLLLVVRRLVFRRDRVAAGHWQRPAIAAVDPWSQRSHRRSTSTVRGWVPAVAVLTVVGLVVWAVGRDVASQDWFPSFRDESPSSAARLGVRESAEPVPAAYRDARWYEGFRRDLAWATDERVAWRPLAVQRIRDVHTTTVNVVDRVRRSWTAPPCECRRLTVWFYGGSGAFGLGQRDDHTVASELARAAARDGVVLDVQNRGVPGEMHWRDATRFSWDLSVEPKAPDLAVFYEGAEEVQSELELRRRGLGDVLAPFEAFLTEVYDEVAQVPATPPPPPPGVSLVGWPRLSDNDPGKGRLATTRYARSLAMTDASSKVSKVPVRYYWQPSRFDRLTDARSLDADERARRAVYLGASASVPDGVVSLADALDDVDGPLFSDDTNHNEVAAEAIGEAMWRDLRRNLPRGAAG